MTLPSSGAISLGLINAEFQLGFGMVRYTGVRWYQDNTATGTFPGSNLKFSSFYSKRATSPVIPGSYTFTGSGWFYTPVYSVLTVTIRGGGGGGAGGSGTGLIGTQGGDGLASSFGSYGAAPGGSGGTAGSTGTTGAGSDGIPSGGTGGAGAFTLSGGQAIGVNGGNGGAGGKTVLTLTTPVGGGSGPAAFSPVEVTVGNAGAGGAGGWFPLYGTVFRCANGSDGGIGSVTVEWS